MEEINSYILGEKINSLQKGKASSNLSEFEQTHVKFLEAAIRSIPQALDDEANLGNAVFIFALPGPQFALKSGAGDWEYYFSQDDNNKITMKCTRKPLEFPEESIIDVGFPEEAIIKVKQINSHILGEKINSLQKKNAFSSLSELDQTQVKFLREAIHFIPQALNDRANLKSAIFIFALPGRQFAFKSGAGDWEYYFSQDNNNKITGRCTRKPWVYYVWDAIKFACSIIPRLLSGLLSVFITVGNLSNASKDILRKNE